MLTIGLTGGIGSGKSTVAKFFAELGIEIIDTDLLAREVVAPGTEGLKEIVAHFGKSVLTAEQTLDRKKIRDLIFQDPLQRKWLEELLHPLIRQKVKERVTQAQSAYCIVAIPLLVESKPNPVIQRVLVVDSPEEQQVVRAHARDNLPLTQIAAIMKTQATRQARLAKADDVIINDKDLAHLKQQVLQLHQKYLTLVAN